MSSGSTQADQSRFGTWTHHRGGFRRALAGHVHLETDNQGEKGEVWEIHEGRSDFPPRGTGPPPNAPLVN